MKIVEVPPWRAYVCMALFSDSIEGALHPFVSARQFKYDKNTYKTVSRLSLYTGIWMVICGRLLSTTLFGRGGTAE